MNSYREKIRDLRNGAQETQAAIKIKDKLTELKSKDVTISSYRWIWELIQNAKDCPNSSGKIDIEINFDEADRKVEFKHNGKLFTTKNIVYLIEQVSTKERTRNSASTGKFGTGFLTTNLLSPIVTISGLLHDEEDTDIAHFEVTLDRSGNSIDEIKESIKNSCEELESNTINTSRPIAENEMNTAFAYMLDDSGVTAAKNGLENFLITAPYVFAFVSELNKITINNNGEISVYTRTQDGDTQSANVFVSRIHKNNVIKPINILVIKEDTLMLAVEIKQYNSENHIIHYDDKLPRLFCDFPLLGTHDFSFPVVINSRSFDPNEPRNGLILYGDESSQNRSILENACSLYASLLEYFLKHNYKDIYNVVGLSVVERKDWIDQKWYEEEIISILKQTISEAQIFIMSDGSKQTLYDEWGTENIFLSSDDTKEIRDTVWYLSSQLFPHKHVCSGDVDNWYNSLWNECRNYGVLELISEVEKIGTLDKLSDMVLDAIEWLKQLYSLIYSKCSGNADIAMRNNRIFPNQHGDFCGINELKADGGIDEAYKKAASLIGIDLKSELADNRISYTRMAIMSFNDTAYRMINRAQEHTASPERFYKYIIGLQNSNITKQLDFIRLYNSLYSGAPIAVKSVSNYSERLLTIALEYWCNKISAEIAGNKCLNTFCSAYNFNTEDEAEIWLSEFVKYLKSIEKTDLLEKYAVIPNQNGVFKQKSYLYQEIDSIPDFMKDVCQIAGTDFRDDIASAKIDVSKIIPRKKGFKEISEVITKYIREHMNNIRVDSDKKEAFNETYRWLRNRKDDPVVKQHFQELLDHLYWFYNDDEISESISKANDLDNILSKFGISDVKQLEVILTGKEYEVQSQKAITEELLCQYGISSKEELQRIIDSKILGDDFLHYSDSCFDKFQFVQQILQRALTNIQNHLSSLQDYDLADSVLIHKTIFTAKKDGREIYIIARPSDYNEVILYYDAEIDTLDYTKDFELWIEDGKSAPEKLTFGKILRLTGVNRIPLWRIR
ncbi:MAG: ATP-binding protein [Ruminococcus sp.]|nr:ATP-binding protein [Ruminococcus sp.]